MLIKQDWRLKQNYNNNKYNLFRLKTTDFCCDISLYKKFVDFF